MEHRIAGLDGSLEIVWDEIGIAHVYAENVADAYRGMGYAAGRERLWQIHLSSAYANSQAAALLGERFVAQDALQRACNVDGQDHALPDSEGDWIVDAYLDGLNAAVDALTDVPPEFVHAGATPRHFSREDIAARYRFTCWFQHKSWTEKMMLGRLMATHGIDWFKGHVLHFTDRDAACIETLAEPLSTLDMTALRLAYPELPEARVAPLSGSNNWAVSGARSASGKPMLATDPHQPHSIPNTFFYVHLHTPDWDAFGAAFPGVPYFMMGYTRQIAWGLTTGFVDNYDVYIEQLRQGEVRTAEGWNALEQQRLSIEVKGQAVRELDIQRSAHGPLLESLGAALELNTAAQDHYATALQWALADVPTSAGALARLPLAANAEMFGEYLFENDVCPLVNNIICVDAQGGMERYIATTMRARQGVSGSVPLAGWAADTDFPMSTREQLTVERNPENGFSVTANDDTMGEQGPFYIHNFPASSDRADRIRQLIDREGARTVDEFKAAQLDLRDLRADRLLPDLLDVLHESDLPRVQLAWDMLSRWDHVASEDSGAACIFYAFSDRTWATTYMRDVLDDPLVKAIPLGAPGLNRFDIAHFLKPGSPWREHYGKLKETICSVMDSVMQSLQHTLGEDAERWRYGDLHQVQFGHRLAGHDPWASMSVGPEPIGGSPTTLNMAMHMGPGPGRAKPGEIPMRVYHGPAFRLIVDLADPERAQFVIAGGNGGQAGSEMATNQYASWLAGRYHTIEFQRDKVAAQTIWRCPPA